jgi:D-glycero-D-manno-heptose 1,7-bisphosphate phosphatase
MTKLIILDKDGTLVQSISGSKYPSFQDQQLIFGVKERICAHGEQGDILAIASNQGGIALGHKSLDQTIAEFIEVLGLLPQIKVACFCPDLEGQILDRIWGDGTLETLKLENFAHLKPFRKPEPGMLQYLMDIFQGMYTDVLFVGNMDSDAQAAAAARIKYLDVEEWLQF